jgi:hypothetical protein
MFQSNTVFVLGAGSSYEAGMPLGKHLKKEVANSLHIKLDSLHRFEAGCDQSIVQAIMEDMEGSKNWRKDLSPYLQAFDIIKKAAPHAASIDNLLLAHEKDDMVKLFGKVAICNCILKAEKGIKFSSDKMEDTWFVEFFRILCADISKEQIEDIFKNIVIINFNYDRCIDAYITNTLQEYFNLNQNQVTNLMSRLTVIHPYGHVGKVFGDSSRRVPFGASVDGKTLLEISSGIRTFSEQMRYETDIRRIGEALHNAKTVVFLGFHFHRQNVQLLKPLEPTTGQRIFFTAPDASVQDLNYIQAQIQMAFGTSEHELINHDGKCHSFFKAFGRALQA